MRRLILLVSAACFLNAHSFAATLQRSKAVPEYYKSFAQKEDTDRSTRVVLRNGLTVLVEEQPLRPLAAVVTLVRDSLNPANSSDIRRKVRRLAESAAELADLSRSAGGKSYSISDADGTFFVSLMPSDNVLDALQAHSKLLKPWNLPAEKTAAVLADLNQDMQERAAFPHQSAEDEVLRLSQRMPESSNAPEANLDQLRGFHGTHYQPAAALVAVSGAVARETILRTAVQLYGGLKSGGKPEQKKAAEPDLKNSSFQYRHLRGALQNQMVLLAYRIPASTWHPDHYPLLVLAALLGEGRGARLPASLGSENLAVRLGVDLVRPSPVGLLQITLVPEGSKVDRAEIQTLAQIDLLQKQPPAPAEVDRARAMVIRDYYASWAFLDERAKSMLRQETRGTYRDWEKVPEIIARVTTADVRRVAGRYLNTSNLALLEYFPPDAEIRNFTPESLLETFKLLLPAADEAAAEVKPPAQKAAKGFTPPSFTPRLLDYELKRTSVLRGPEIYLKEEHVAPVVDVVFLYPGGRIEESSQNAGLTELMMEALLLSAESREGAAVWSDLERWGTRLQIVNEPDFFGLRASVLSSNLPRLLSRLLPWLRQPSIQAETLERARGIVEAARADQSQDPFQKARLQIRQGVFGDHPYARSRFGEEASLRSATLEMVQSWATKQLENFHPLIVLRGDMEGTAFLPDLIPELSNSKFKTKEKISQATSPKEFTLASTSAGRRLLAGLPGPALGSRDNWILDILESLVQVDAGQIFADAKLFESDDVQLLHQTNLSGGIVFFTAPLESGTPEQAARSISDHIQRLEDGPIKDQDFLKAVVLTITRFYLDQQDAPGYLLQLAKNLFGGENVDYQNEYLSTLKGAQVEGIRQLARQTFPAPVGAAQDEKTPETVP